MSAMQLSTQLAAEILQAELTGGSVVFNGVSTDTRNLQPGQLFIAIQGENFDGHDFIEQAIQAGAAAVVIKQDKNFVGSVPVLKVADTLAALAALARYVRDSYHIPLLAVTGSCGKTTTKMLLSSVFSQVGKTLANPSSFNNNIGVPLTLLQLTPEYEYVITELGANHPGEIAELTALVRPDVAIITNAGPAHLEGFGSVAGVAQAKGEIFLGLSEEGVAIINADDAFASFWQEKARPHRILTFALQQPADIMAKNISLNENTQPSFELVLPTESCNIQLQLMGQHNIYNALAAAAAGYAQELPISRIKAGLEAATAVVKRLVESKGLSSAVIIDDTYNANPTSMLAAIQLLASRTGQKSAQESFLVMGEMKELGDESVALHQQIGELAKQHGINKLFCLGPNTRYTAEAFGENGHFFYDREQLLTSLKPQLHDHAIVLVKGSRSMAMETVVAALK